MMPFLPLASISKVPHLSELSLLSPPTSVTNEGGITSQTFLCSTSLTAETPLAVGFEKDASSPAHSETSFTIGFSISVLSSQ